MRVGNDPEWDSKSPMAGLLKLQTEFYARLTEETLKYLRHVQAASLPSTPGTVLLPREGLQLETSGAPGDSVELQLEIENRQRVHCVVTPMLSPFVSQRLVMLASKERASDQERLAPLLESGQVTPTIDRTYPLDRVSEALCEIESGTARGKLVIDLGS